MDVVISFFYGHYIYNNNVIFHITTFLTFLIDKILAKSNRWRIDESYLKNFCLLTPFTSIFSMFLIKHKIRKFCFYVFIFTGFFINVVAINFLNFVVKIDAIGMNFKLNYERHFVFFFIRIFAILNFVGVFLYLKTDRSSYNRTNNVNRSQLQNAGPNRMGIINNRGQSQQVRQNRMGRINNRSQSQQARPNRMG